MYAAPALALLTVERYCFSALSSQRSNFTEIPTRLHHSAPSYTAPTATAPLELGRRRMSKGHVPVARWPTSMGNINTPAVYSMDEHIGFVFVIPPLAYTVSAKNSMTRLQQLLFPAAARPRLCGAAPRDCQDLSHKRSALRSPRLMARNRNKEQSEIRCDRGSRKSRDKRGFSCIIRYST
ncbi:hypothetical protein EVAR_78555_1 [Eumeta japonica]|uniref:Uncharacterized protein n=1 Tax=Eumeta variegata TaxID=151549 RepID=A0A4C1W761_EUMVA|nr:hypothetical protein EVAR_78555_1 [Eumeta japonica]